MADNKSWGGFFGDADKQRADDAEAMWLGTAFGAAKAVGKIRAEHDEEVAEIARNLELSIGTQVHLMAERDAQTQLNEAIVGKLKHPERERRFSAPDADLARGRLLQDAYRHSTELTIERGKLKKKQRVDPSRLAKSAGGWRRNAG